MGQRKRVQPKTNHKNTWEKQVRKKRPLSGKIKNKQKDSVHKSDKIDPGTISG